MVNNNVLRKLLPSVPVILGLALGAIGFGCLGVAAVLHWLHGEHGYVFIWLAGVTVLTLALRPAYKLHRLHNPVGCVTQSR